MCGKREEWNDLHIFSFKVTIMELTKAFLKRFFFTRFAFQLSKSIISMIFLAQ
jgi:hypothetical protein